MINRYEIVNKMRIINILTIDLPIRLIEGSLCFLF